VRHAETLLSQKRAIYLDFKVKVKKKVGGLKPVRAIRAFLLS
jgi:hypothetical protein